MATTTQILRYVVEADTKSGVAGFKEVEQQATGASGKLQGLIDKSPALQGALGKVGLDASSAAGGISAMASTLGPAALGAVMTKGISDFQNLAGEVLKFQRVAGTTAEESSRWVEVLGDYNISADQGAASIGKFAKVIGTTPEVLQRWGVEIQKNKDGTVDLSGTLLKASDVFRNTTDETKRAALGAALFGKSWQDMVPILEQGSGDIRKALDSVAQGKIMSGQDLKDAEDFRLAIDGLKDVVESLSVTVGKQLVPQLKDLAEVAGTVGGFLDNSLTKKLFELAKYINPAAPVTVGVKKLGESLGDVRDEFVGTEKGLGLVAGASQVFADKAKKAAEAVDLENEIVQEGSRLKGEHADVTAVLAEKEKAAAAATKLAEKAASDYAQQLAELTKRNEELLKATEDNVRAHEIDMPKALDDVTESLLTYYKTTEESQKAQQGLAEGSAEYQLEAIKQRDAGRDLTQAMLDYGNEAVKAAEAQAALNGRQLTAEEKATILAGALTSLGQQFPPLKAEADKLAGSFGGVAGQAEDAASRIDAAFAGLADRMAGHFNRITDAASGLSMLAATADQLERVAASADNAVASIAAYEKRNGPGWRT